VVDPPSDRDREGSAFIWPPEKIAAIGAAPESFPPPSRVIDAKRMWVCVRVLVDLSARLREPGFEHKGHAGKPRWRPAVAGGVTSLACPPDTDPPLDEPGLVEMLKHRARSLNQAHVYPLGALTLGLKGERITEWRSWSTPDVWLFRRRTCLLTTTR